MDFHEFRRESERWHRQVARSEARMRLFSLVFGIIVPCILAVLMILHYAHIHP